MTTSRPPSKPTKYSQGIFSWLAFFARASARLRAPAMISARVRGVWRTPLSASTPMTSNCELGSRVGPKTETASHTALSLGRRVLPTATIIFFMAPASLNGILRALFFPELVLFLAAKTGGQKTLQIVDGIEDLVRAGQHPAADMFVGY